MTTAIRSSCACAAAPLVTQVPPATPGASHDGQPPDPIPVSAPGPVPMPVPVSASWPQWQQRFVQLGLGAADIEKIRSARLTDTQLEQVHAQIVARQSAGSSDGWNESWQQKFSALGVPADYVRQVAAEAQRRGATGEQLQAAYDSLVAALGVAPSDTSANLPGWDAAFEQRFRALGMPNDVIDIYAKSGMSRASLIVALHHAAARVEDFRSRGWMDRFVAAKVPDVEIWTLILGDQPASDEQLKQALDAAKSAHSSLVARFAQAATSLIPGGRLVQYVLGREVISGEEIDRSKPFEIGMAALSAASVFLAIRGVRYLRAGRVAAAAAATDAAVGATQTWGVKQRLQSLISGTGLHREIAAAGSAVSGGAGAATLNLGLDGVARTPSGLIVPSYSSAVSGLAPAGVDAEALRLFAQMTSRIRPPV